MTKKLFKYVKKFLPLIGITILIFIIYSLNFEEIKNAFLSINPIFIVIALSLTLPLLIIRNYCWQLILKEQKIKVSFLKSLKIFLIGFFYCSITPGFIGHLIRVPYMKEETSEPYGKLFINVFIDSTVRSISSFLMIIAGALIVIGSYPELFWINIAIFIINMTIILYFIKKERGEKLLYKLTKYLIPKKLKKDFYRFIDTFYVDFPRIIRLIPPFLLSFVTWIIVFTQVYILVLALGLEIPYLHFILLFPIANLAGLLPITVAGIGVREGTAILIFTLLFAVSKEDVFVFTLVGFIITDLFIGFIGFLVSLTEVRKKVIIKPLD